MGYRTITPNRTTETAHPTAEQVIELSTDREEYQFQLAALIALSED